MKVKFLSILFILILTSLFITYINFYKYSLNINKDIELLQKGYNSFNINYFDAVPKNKEDFQKIIDWNEYISGNMDLSFLNYGYNVEYDSIKGTAIVYTYGKDEMDNSIKYTPFNDKRVNNLDQYPIINLTFLNYVKNLFKQNDIILLNLKSSNFPCESLLKDNQLRYELYTDYKELLSNEKIRNNFLNSIHEFELLNKENKNKKLLYFIYKDKKVKVLCNNNTDLREIKKIEILLGKFLLSENNANYDYALFPLFW